MNDVLWGIVIGGCIGVLSTIAAGIFDLIRTNSLHIKEFEKKILYENFQVKKKCYSVFLQYSCWLQIIGLQNMENLSDNARIKTRDDLIEKTKSLFTKQVEAMVDINLFASYEIARKCNLLMHTFSNLPKEMQKCTSLEEMQKMELFIAFCNELELIVELMRKDLFVKNKNRNPASLKRK